MWSRYRGNILKLTAILAVIFFLYPCILIVRNGFFHTSGRVLEFLSAILTVFTGYAITFLLCGKKYALFRLLLVYAGMAIPASAFVYVYLGRGIGRAVFELIAAAVLYIVGIYGYLRSYDVFFNGRTLYAGAISLFIGMLIACINEKYFYLKGIITLFAFLFLLLSLVLKSQENLDFIFNKRGVELPEVRQKIRSSGTKAVVVFFAVVLLLLNSRKIVIFILEAVKLAGGKLMDAVIYLLKLLLRHKGGPVYEDGYGFMPFDPQPAAKPWVVLLFYTVIHFILLFLLYKLAPVLYKGLLRFAAYIKNTFLKLFDVRYRREAADNDEYSETVEQVRKTKSKKTKHKKANPFVQLEITSDPMEKIRLMYGILLEKLSGKGISVQRSDTTGQIFTKSSSLEEIRKPLQMLTEVYDDVRYGELIPSEPVLTMSQKELKEAINALNDKTP